MNHETKRRLRIKELHELGDTLRSRRWKINQRMHGVDFEYLLSSGLREEEIAALFQIPVEDVTELYQFERDAKAAYARFGRKISEEYGTYDFFNPDFAANSRDTPLYVYPDERDGEVKPFIGYMNRIRRNK